MWAAGDTSWPISTGRDSLAYAPYAARSVLLIVGCRPFPHLATASDERRAAQDTRQAARARAAPVARAPHQ